MSLTNSRKSDRRIGAQGTVLCADRKHRGRFSVLIKFSEKTRVVAGFHARHLAINLTHRTVPCAVITTQILETFYVEFQDIFLDDRVR